LRMDRGDLGDFLDWWVVLRSLIDGRPAHTAGAVDFRDRSGAPLDLQHTFSPDDDDGETPPQLSRAIAFLADNDVPFEADRAYALKGIAGFYTASLNDRGFIETFREYAVTEGRDLLKQALASRRQTGLSITIGAENPDARLTDFTLVTASYEAGELKGVIGVMGPTRMPYDKIIGLVEHTSRLVEDLLE